MSEPTPKRKPGGQPGNRNSLKHGYYARRIPPKELASLAKVDPLDLTGELQVIRYLIAIITERARDVQDPALAVSMLRAISLAAITLARIQRTQQIIAASTSNDDFALALNTALAQLMAEARLGPEADPLELQALAAQLLAERQASLNAPSSLRPIPPVDQPYTPLPAAAPPAAQPTCAGVPPSACPPFTANTGPLIPDL